MLTRRNLLLAIATAMMPVKLMASVGRQESISWSEFYNRMMALANADAMHQIKRAEVADLGMRYLKQLDIHSSTYKAKFKVAVEGAYESGNRYWLWQRLIKDKNINGGILNINNSQLVQLHDHPGAIGMVRIISGEVEVWQFDEVMSSESNKISQLTRLSHKVLRVGDTAILTPTKGNIHALKAVTKDCRMLDFFIPPYESSQRYWFEPLAEDWFDREQISCRKIPQYAYEKA